MKSDEIIKRKLRIRNKLKRSNTNNRLRLTVNRSSKNISAQIIDDLNNKTIVAASSVEKDIKKINKTKNRNCHYSLVKHLQKGQIKKI